MSQSSSPADCRRVTARSCRSRLTNGKVLLAGDGKLRRYTAQGQLDTTFGNGGEVDSPISSFLYETSVDVTADGRPVVAGMVQSHCYGTVVAPYPARCFKFDAALARFQS